jgi:dolichyl-phosphate-mannose-protein mannosyltransferase
MGLTLTPSPTSRQFLLIGLLISLLAAAVFTRFWRLGTPDDIYFDELHFVTNSSQEIVRGDPAAWEWFEHENTHPPLSKLFMAGGMAIFGVVSSGSITGEVDNPFAWRFFGALASVGSVVFIYLLGKRLFKSEVAGMAAAFLMVFDGLFFVQSRMATPDTYLVFFILGSIYFLLRDRLLFSGIFLGAALATKWTAILTLFPVGLYLIYRFLRTDRSQWRQFLTEVSIAVPLFFLVVPLSIYLLTYVPMLFSGRTLADAWELNHLAFDFHRDRELTHPYSSPWNTWPIMMRPVFLYLSDSGAKIYSLGNPVIFWLGLPALAYALWQGLRGVRARLDETAGRFSVSGSVGPEQAALLFVVLTYLGFFLPWAIQPRIMFIYHYLPSLPFLLLALAYVIHRLWQRSWGRGGAVLFLVGAALTFIYFYPHLAAVEVSDSLAESYFWFSSWR